MTIHLNSRAGAVASLGLVVALALGACSSSESSGAVGSAEPGAVAPGALRDATSGAAKDARAPAAVAPAPAAPAAGPPAAPQAAGAPPVQAQKLARSATVRLGVSDVAAGASGVRGVALGAGGSVTAEDIGTAAGERGGDRGTMTLAVPADRLDAVLDQLGLLGSVAQRTLTSQDVTSAYVDTASRVATMKASVDRLRALVAQTTTIAQIVDLETELSRREADLESLQATLATLDKQVALSTVTVTLTPTTAAAPVVDAGSGFLVGMRHGWDAFSSAAVGVLTALGAVLPFAATLALLGLPGVVWWRRRLRAEVPPPAAVAAVSEQ